MGERTQHQGLRPLDSPRSLAEDAADRIREQILSGGFHQGEHLVETRIAEQLSVSRGPVREAFKLLRAEGLVEEEPRRGTFVVSLNSADVREIYGLRAAVEGRAARLVASSGTPAAVGEIRDLLNAIERAADRGDRAGVFQRDLDFHEGLCRLSGNARLQEVFMRYVPMLRALLRLDDRVYDTMDAIAAQHRPLVEAIERGDAGGAARHAEEHCDQAALLISAYLDGQRP